MHLTSHKTHIVFIFFSKKSIKTNMMDVGILIIKANCFIIFSINLMLKESRESL